MSERSGGGPRVRTGVVESDRRDKTRRVVVRSVAKHPKYGKYVARRTVVQAHDEANESRTGDIVEVAECRPISRTKSWRIVRVVDRRSARLEAHADQPEVNRT
jgi:small subunit ribosomal protein S17